jgi:hypothetical protein
MHVFWEHLECFFPLHLIGAPPRCPSENTAEPGGIYSCCLNTKLWSLSRIDAEAIPPELTDDIFYNKNKKTKNA